MFDFSLPPTDTGICYKYQTLAEMKVPYFYGIMNTADTKGSDHEYKAPRATNVLDTSDVGVIGLIGDIQHVTHYYTEKVYLPGYARFSKVKFSMPESTNEELKHKWTQRMRITLQGFFLNQNKKHWKVQSYLCLEYAVYYF